MKSLVTAIFAVVVGEAGITHAAGIRILHPKQSVRDTQILKRVSSQDPSCPPGFLCQQQACPSNIVCEPGETCISFEGTIACAPQALEWCAFNPETLQAVGCDGGKCCHGNCYSKDAVCCNAPSNQCQIGTLCNACAPGAICQSDGSCSATTPIGSPISSTTLQPTTNPLGQPTISSTKVPPSSGPRPTDSSASSSSMHTTSSTAAMTPTVVPSVGDFTNQGCFADSTSQAALIAANTTDAALTVAKCISFAEANAWQFAALEGTLCRVGNSLHNTSAIVTSQASCTLPCPGDTSEICGGSGDHIQVYRDTTWTIPPDAQVAVALQALNVTILDGLALVSQYQGNITLLDQLQKQQTGSSRRRGRRQSQTQTIEQTRQALVNTFQESRDYIGRLQLVGGTVRRQVIQSIELDNIPSPGSPVPTGTEEDLHELEQGLSEISSRISSVISDEQTDAASITSSTALLTDLAAHEADSAAAITAIGVPGTLLVGAGAATGICLVLAGLINLYLHGSGGIGAPSSGTTSLPSTTTPPPTRTMTMTTTSSSTTLTCTPETTPVEAVVLLTEDTTDTSFDGFLADLKRNNTPILDSTTYSTVSFYICLVEIDDCQALELVRHPLVETVSANAETEVEVRDGNADDADDDVEAPNSLNVAAASSNSTRMGRAANQTSLMARASDELTFSSKLNTYDDVAYPLTWLTNPALQIGFGGLGNTFYDISQFAFDASTVQTPRSKIVAYIIDTGLQRTHDEFGFTLSNRGYNTITQGKEGSGSNYVDTDGHGTMMASCLLGDFGGVFKHGQVVPIKASSQNFKSYSTLAGIGAAMSDVYDETNKVDFGVVTMAWGFDKDSRGFGQFSSPDDPFRIKILSREFAAKLVAIATTGNDGEKTNPVAKIGDRSPQVWATRDTPIIVVGECGVTGKRSPTSTYLDDTGNGLLSLYMLAGGVTAWPINNDDTSQANRSWRRNYGTSPASAYVAGVVASLMASGQCTPATCKQKLLQASRVGKGVWASDGPGSGQDNGGPPRASSPDLLVPCQVTEGSNAATARGAERAEAPLTETFIGDLVDGMDVRLTDFPCVAISATSPVPKPFRKTS